MSRPRGAKGPAQLADGEFQNLDGLKILIAAARQTVEARGGLALLTQSWRLSLDAAPDIGEAVILPRSPIASVDMISVIDAAGAPQIVPADLYETSIGAVGRVAASGAWPSAGPKINSVRIDFTAGWESPSETPRMLSQAVLLLVGHFYEHREAAGNSRIYPLPLSLDAMIAPYKQVRL